MTVERLKLKDSNLAGFLFWKVHLEGNIRKQIYDRRILKESMEPENSSLKHPTLVRSTVNRPSVVVVTVMVSNSGHCGVEP